MLQSVEGIYRNGEIELLETPDKIKESRVIITFLNEADENDSSDVDLSKRGISKEEAAQQRAAFAAFAEDWERPEMEIYDKL